MYLIDESSDYARINNWAATIAASPGVGRNLQTFATIAAPAAASYCPALSIACSTRGLGPTQLWVQAASFFSPRNGKKLYFYNGYRPMSGSFATEDEGASLRQLGWIQHKKNIQRWFYWESTYYNNFQHGTGETNVFRQAKTFGGTSGKDPVMGETGRNYTNGDGVLFYPGTDLIYPQDSYGLDGPIASLRLKYWRRGIQDADYLEMAKKISSARTAAIVERMVPKVLWEYGVSDPADPTWILGDISWSTNPDDWEAARRELAEIIEGRG